LHSAIGTVGPFPNQCQEGLGPCTHFLIIPAQCGSIGAPHSSFHKSRNLPLPLRCRTRTATPTAKAKIQNDTVRSLATPIDVT
jgi:hypothetical protein